MTEVRFDTVDVFTNTRYLGNPLAVVHAPAGLAQPLSQEQKQRIAREFNLSETVILHENPDGNPAERKVDIFVVNAEIPFAGHPTIGTLCHVGSQLAKQCTDSTTTTTNNIPIILHIKAGTIRANYSPTTGYARASIPHDVHFSSTATPADTGCVFPTSPSHSQARPSIPSLPYPIVSPTKGMTFMLVELADQAALDACRTSMMRPLDSVLEHRVRPEVKPSLLGTYFWTYVGRAGNADERGVRAFVLETRMMLADIPPEDPATGSAACSLATALSTWRRRRAGGGGGGGREGDSSEWHKPACLEEMGLAAQGERRDRYEITQGRAMGRRSEIVVEVLMREDDGGGIEEVALEGTAVGVMSGSLIV